jgi:hypothetical protein
MTPPGTAGGDRPLLLSVVVVVVSDTTDARVDVSHLRTSLEALAQQLDAPPMEIVVPYLAAVHDLDSLKASFPGVVFLPVRDVARSTARAGDREHHDELRARGLAASRGTIVALLEDHAVADRRWAAEVVDAHRQDVAAVGGAIENAVDRPLNWAIYFCDFGRYQNPVPEGDSPFVSDANASYKRAALETIAPVWRGSFCEPAVNAALIEKGGRLMLSSRMIVYQRRAGLRVWPALRERFVWGRSYGAGRGAHMTPARRLVYAALTPLLPAVLLARIARTTIQRGRHVGAFLRALPLTGVLTACWSCGELAGYAAARGRGARRL